jgi:hypothetical protein
VYPLPNFCHALPPVDWLALTKTQLSATFSVIITGTPRYCPPSLTSSFSAPSESKPAWKVLKVLADLLELPGFHYANSEQITSEISNQSHQYKVDNVGINKNAIISYFFSNNNWHT